tara:strand:- start:71 stop:520 length:450 start_codon:yes stop_codon:yes gene_type:complete
MSTHETLESFFEKIDLDIITETIDVGVFENIDASALTEFDVTCSLLLKTVETQTEEVKKCKLCRRLKRKLKQFRGIFSRLEDYDDGAAIADNISVGNNVNVFWPATEEIAVAKILSVNYSACTVHVKWLGPDTGLETEDLSMSWIIPDE